MLDLGGVFCQIDQMVKQCKINIDVNGKKMSVANEKMIDLKGKWNEISIKVEESKTSWLVADPLEEVGAVYSPVELPDELNVLASDGSQLFPDHHQVVLCYLINIGRVLIRYGKNADALLTNDARLYFKEEDLYINDDGVKRLVDTQHVSAVRTLSEAQALVELSQQCSHSGKSVAFTDGSLIHWAAEQQTWAKEFLEGLLLNYEYLRQFGIPLAGYISSTRSADVINMLRVAICPQTRVDCDHCPMRNQPDAPCEQVAGLRDASLFNERLKYGQRSAVFKSRSKVLDKYGSHRICFFYVNIGPEVARVEIPLWVAQNKDFLNLVHSVVIDQSAKGIGYPVCLIEAHQQAVVTGADRELFYQLVNKKLIENGITGEVSYKNLRKRSVPI